MNKHMYKVNLIADYGVVESEDLLPRTWVLRRDGKVYKEVCAKRMQGGTVISIIRAEVDNDEDGIVLID